MKLLGVITPLLRRLILWRLRTLGETRGAKCAHSPSWRRCDSPSQCVKNMNGHGLLIFSTTSQSSRFSQSLTPLSSLPEQKNETSQSSENGSSTIQGERAMYVFSEDWRLRMGHSYRGHSHSAQNFKGRGVTLSSWRMATILVLILQRIKLICKESNLSAKYQTYRKSCDNP